MILYTNKYYILEPSYIIMKLSFKIICLLYHNPVRSKTDLSKIPFQFKQATKNSSMWLCFITNSSFRIQFNVELCHCWQSAWASTRSFAVISLETYVIPLKNDFRNIDCISKSKNLKHDIKLDKCILYRYILPGNLVSQGIVYDRGGVYQDYQMIIKSA